MFTMRLSSASCHVGTSQLSALPMAKAYDSTSVALTRGSPETFCEYTAMRTTVPRTSSLKHDIAATATATTNSMFVNRLIVYQSHLAVFNVLFYSVFARLVVSLSLFDYGTVGLWDYVMTRPTLNLAHQPINLARSAPYFSLFTFHLSVKKASQTPNLSLFTFYFSLRLIASAGVMSRAG